MFAAVLGGPSKCLSVSAAARRAPMHEDLASDIIWRESTRDMTWQRACLFLPHFLRFSFFFKAWPQRDTAHLPRIFNISYLNICFTYTYMRTTRVTSTFFKPSSVLFKAHSRYVLRPLTDDGRKAETYANRHVDLPESPRAFFPFPYKLLASMVVTLEKVVVKLCGVSPTENVP